MTTTRVRDPANHLVLVRQPRSARLSHMSRPRNEFVPTIERMVRRLQQQSTHTVSERHSVLGRVITTTFQVTRLHVFGSFARGAPNCGDLDVILCVQLVEGMWCDDATIIRSALGRLVGVDALCDQGGSLLSQFPEAKLLWSPDRPNLAENLGCITIRHEASRFARKTDQLPVSLRQLRLHDRTEAEQLVDDITSGIFVSTWRLLDSIQIDRKEWDQKLVQCEKSWSAALGRQSAKLLPYVIQHNADRRSGRLPLRPRLDKTSAWIDGDYAYIGVPPLSLHRLERPDTTALVLAPHIKKQYPPGIWTIERGNKHPAIAAFSDLTVWVEAIDGEPVPVSTHLDPDRISRTIIDLFPSEAEASESISEWATYGDPKDCGKPLALSGRALLKSLARVEGVSLEESEVIVHYHTKTSELANRIGAWLKERRSRLKV